MQPQAPLPQLSHLHNIVEDVINGYTKGNLPQQSIKFTKVGNFTFYGSDICFKKISGWLEFQTTRKICTFTWFRGDIPLVEESKDRSRKILKAQVLNYECFRCEGKWQLKCIQTSLESIRRFIVRLPNSPTENDTLIKNELFMQQEGEKIASKYRSVESGSSAASYHVFPIRSKHDRGILEMRQNLYHTDLSNAFIPPLLRLKYFKQIVMLVDRMHRNGDIHCNLSLKSIVIDFEERVFLSGFEVSQSQTQYTVISQAKVSAPEVGLLQTVLTDKLALGLMFGSLILGTPFAERLVKLEPPEFYEYLMSRVAKDKNHVNQRISIPMDLFLQWHTKMEECQEELKKTLNSPFSETHSIGDYLVSDQCKPELFNRFVTGFGLETPPLSDLLKLIDAAIFFISSLEEPKSIRRIRV